MVQNNEIKWKVQIKYTENSRPKLEIKPWGILITLSEGMDENEAYRIIEKYELWIKEKQADLLKILENSRNIKLIERSKIEFKDLIEKIMEQTTKEVLGINPCKIFIRKMKTRWASCSKKGTITINELARYLPSHLISYIIYHEVCHIIEPKHNKEFYVCVQKYYSNYRELERELLLYEIKLGLA